MANLFKRLLVPGASAAAYFTALSMRGKPVSSSVEGYIHSLKGHSALGQRAEGLLKDGLEGIGYLESR